VSTPTAPALSAAEVDALATALFDAFESGHPVDPPTERHPGMSVADAYRVQQGIVARHEAAGRTVTGRKIGLTSDAMRAQLGVEDPDFGVLLDTRTFTDAATVSMSGLNAIAPKLEGEIGFVLKRPLAGPGITAQDVIDATDRVLPVFELIDSRVRDWKIGLADTISDNASALGAVLGEPVVPQRAGDLAALSMRFTRDGELQHEGTGAAVMGDPALAVAWLANELGRHGDELPAGEPILSGSLTAAIDATPGVYVADFGPALGSVTVTIGA
jgi:2-keto-4-pentenoate hydratase